MRKNFQLYKTIILVAASAITLIAVTFAWFGVSNNGTFESFKGVIEGDPVSVDFYQKGTDDEYAALDGDITLNNFVPGSYNCYKMLVTTKTADPLKLSFTIDDLPSDMPAALKSAVQIKYTLVKDSSDGSSQTVISESNGYISLDEYTDGVIFGGIDLTQYQSAKGDIFTIYYEIGLDPNSSSDISLLSSSLGYVNISAQRVGIADGGN